MKKVLISIIAIICLLSMSTIVKAATTGNVTLAASQTTIQAGTEFSIIASATDSNNLNTVEYSGITITDAEGNVTPNITIKSIETANDLWAKMANGSNTAFVYSGSATQSSEVFKINLIASDSITAGEYKINVEGLKVYSSNLQDDTTTVGTKSITVKVIVDETTVPNTETDTPKQNTEVDNTNTTTPTTTNNSNTNTTNNSATKSANNTAVTNTTKKKTTLPQTGLEMTSFFAIIVLGTAAVGSFISYKKYKEI